MKPHNVRKPTFLGFLFTLIMTFQAQANIQGQPDDKLHTFYYSWYGNPAQDKQWVHWDHKVLPFGDRPLTGRTEFPGGEDIGANFYPQLGTYSSHAPEIIKKHIQMMKQANIGVVSYSWWGKEDFASRSVITFMDEAQKAGLKVNFHIEPIYKNAKEFKQAIATLMALVGEHPALYRLDGKPLYYIYDSYKVEVSQWRQVLADDGQLSLRNTALDGHFIGLWVEQDDGKFFTEGHFDGFYTYFAVDGFVYGSTTANWPNMSAFAKENKMMFIPCVGPGYADDRIRPWNGKNYRSRQQGKYYDDMFKAAIDMKPQIIGITSFNEWHEGTQIEPAIAKTFEGYRYEDYSPLAPDYYLHRTAYWQSHFAKSQSE